MTTASGAQRKARETQAGAGGHGHAQGHAHAHAAAHGHPHRSGAPDRGAEMLAAVRASGLKLTPQRLAIVAELAADPTHPTAQELFERLRPTLPTMSFATVYNTLDALAAAGLCAALSLSPGASRFDPNMRPHHHAVCDQCGLVRDVPASVEAEPAGDEGPIGAAPGFEIRAVERIYRGLCADCSAAQGAQGTAARTRRGALPRQARTPVPT